MYAGKIRSFLLFLKYVYKEFYILKLNMKKAHKNTINVLAPVLFAAVMAALAVLSYRLNMVSLPLPETGTMAAAAGRYHTVGLRSDGTVTATDGPTSSWCRVYDLTGIAGITAGHDYTICLREDGTVLALGMKVYERTKISEWKDIVQISMGRNHVAGLTQYGKVVAAGENLHGQCDLSGWRNIIAVAAGDQITIGLRNDGTVIAAGKNDHGQCEVSEWNGITAVSAWDSTAGIREDGTAVIAGAPYDLSSWKDLVCILESSCIRHGVNHITDCRGVPLPQSIPSKSNCPLPQIRKAQGVLSVCG